MMEVVLVSEGAEGSDPRISGILRRSAHRKPQKEAPWRQNLKVFCERIRLVPQYYGPLTRHEVLV